MGITKRRRSADIPMMNLFGRPIRREVFGFSDGIIGWSRGGTIGVFIWSSITRIKPLEKMVLYPE
jgi:hypothetical protein